MNRHYDHIIIGGGLSGVTTAHILTNYGFKVLLLEKGPALGSFSTSFLVNGDCVFDYGYHTLDFNRSEFTTQFFAKVLDHQFHKFQLKRGLVIRSNLIDYGSGLENWPSTITQNVDRKSFRDDLVAPVNREKLVSVYGKYLTELALDEILPAYPSLAWRRNQGQAEAELLDLIYPWFFPKAEKLAAERDESKSFHNAVRTAGAQYVLYPRSGGFGAFIDGIVRKIDPALIEVKLGLDDLKIEVDAERKRITGLTGGGVRYSATKYFWCAPITTIAKLCGLAQPQGTLQYLALASFVFNKEVNTTYHELLVGDPRFSANRISFPGLIGQRKNNLVQLEYFYPKGFREITAEVWRADCLAKLRELGVITDHEVVGSTFHHAPRGFVTTENTGALLADYARELKVAEANIIYPHVGLGPENINRVIPSTFREVLNSIL